MGQTVAEHPLRKWRKSKGYTLEQAAKMVGTSRPVWCDWERGRRRPSPTFMPKLRDLTGISADIFYSEPQRDAA